MVKVVAILIRESLDMTTLVVTDKLREEQNFWSHLVKYLPFIYLGYNENALLSLSTTCLIKLSFKESL